MKIGLFPFGLAPTDYAAIAADAERLGFESFWLPDHLVMPVEIASAYPYSGDGDSGLTHRTPFIDPWVALSFVAAATRSIRLGTYVYVLPMRHPFTTARAIGSLDLLAGGRVLFGIGVGWLSEEFEAAGEDFPNRVSRAREIVAILRSLWVDEVTQHHGDHYDFGPVGMAPRPVQRPIPILFGGQSPAALRRAAELGDGWMGSAQAPDRLADHLAQIVPALERELASRGRRRQDFDITSGVAGVPTLDHLAVAVEAGLDRLIVAPWAAERGSVSVDRSRQTLNDIAETVSESLKQVVDPRGDSSDRGQCAAAGRGVASTG